VIKIDSLNYLTAFIAGVFSFFSPCIMPILPVYLSYMVGFNIISEKEKLKESKIRLYKNALGFILGFTAVFMLIFGFGVSSVIKNIPYFNYLSGIILIAIGLYLLGVLGLKNKISNKSFNIKIAKPNFLYSFLLGITVSIGFTPCASPILGAILVLTSRGSQNVYGVIMLLIYSIGFMVPLMISIIFVDKLIDIIKRADKYLKYTGIIMGVILIILGIIILNDNLKIFIIGG
jgi:cytochrome c-type biogenesis protein